jgi:translation elongation factor EF-Ts
VNSLKQFVESERKQREDSEKTISEMLRSVFAKVKEDIELERKNR